VKPFPTLVLAAAVLVGTLGLSACTEDHDLPTLGGSTSGSAGSDLETVAKTYYDCMTDAGIDVELQQNSQGQLDIVQFSGTQSVMWRSPDGSGGAMPVDKEDPADQQATDDFFSDPDGGAALLVDGVDRSDTYAQCLTESGYDEQAAYGSMRPDPAQMEKQVASNNKWAACARENGWPDVEDSSMSPSNSSWPTIVLPSTVTDDQLHQLLQACPNFDPTQQEMILQWWQDNPMATSYPDDFLPDPSISFDIPSMSASQGPDWTPSAQDEADMERMNHLYDILYEQSNEYYQEHYGG